MTELIKQIHELASLRYAWRDGERVRIVIGPNISESDRPPNPGEPHREVARWCSWDAGIYLGKNEWGDHAGIGATPEEALKSLHRGLLAAHNAVDQRRAEVFKRAVREVS